MTTPRTAPLIAVDQLQKRFRVGGGPLGTLAALW